MHLRTLYRLGQEMLVMFCKDVQCNGTPSVDHCKNCHLNTMSQNLDLWWKNGYDIRPLVYHIRDDRISIIETAKRGLIRQST